MSPDDGVSCVRGQRHAGASLAGQLEPQRQRQPRARQRQDRDLIDLEARRASSASGAVPADLAAQVADGSAHATAATRRIGSGRSASTNTAGPAAWPRL